MTEHSSHPGEDRMAVAKEPAVMVPRAATTLDRAAIGGLAAVTVLVAAGFATFGRDPSLVARVPGALDVYPVAFALAPHVHMWAAAAALAVILLRHANRAWLPALALVYAISLGAELLGTTTGVPFGAYAYDRALAPFWFGHVPVAIPVSWFTVALPAYALAVGRTRGKVAGVLLGAALLTAWDLVLDPAMSGATRYWRWADPGAYYGMPWVNLAGWMLTGVAIMAALELSGARRWVARLPRGALAWVYGLQFLLPALMAASAGFWGALAAGVLALAALLLLPPRFTARAGSERAPVERAFEPAAAERAASDRVPLEAQA